jgi:uncharacterized membrane protein YfcA
MPDFLATLLATDGLVWLVTAAFVAGLVRGFAGFGTAMIFLPAAAQFLTPFEALTVLIVKDLIGPLPNVPRAWRDGHPGDIARLGVGLVIAMPFGVWALTLVPVEVFRYGVSFVALALLVLLVMGFRYRGVLTKKLIYLTGGLGGLLGGSVGIPGPPVIMLYMASTHPPEVIRANNMIYLILADIVLLGLLVAFGEFVPGAIALGLLLALPYLLGNVAGGAIFRPGHERTYRAVAYAIILVSALNGLPFLD